jgi:transcription initiation factor TFIIIB Brf1 subunit/transcription initiation factor TFIIB
MQSHVEFVKAVICSEEMAVQYLSERNLLDDPEEAVINCDKCGSIMQNKRILIHSTFNYQEDYVNPASGTNTLGTERSWLDAKIKILRKTRGTTELWLQSHLNEYCYRVMRKHSQNLLIDFLNDVKSVYR